MDNGYQAGLRLFRDTHDIPSAVFCYNDLVAIGLINALHELQLNVPGDVSVVGFDNIEYCRTLAVPLTTVSIPTYAIGETAAQLLINQIDDSAAHQNEKIIIPSQLIERASVARRT